MLFWAQLAGGVVLVLLGISTIFTVTSQDEAENQRLAASTGRTLGLGLVIGFANPLALVFFNVGVELGQLMFVFAFLVVTRIAARIYTPGGDWIRVVPAYAIGAVAAYWTIERVVSFWA